MVLTKSEKKKAVIELYSQGKTVRQIAQAVHMSFGDISSIIRRETGEDEEQNRIRISKASQALKLFAEGNTPVQVAIKLDMQIAEVDRIYKEYSESNGLYDFDQVYEDVKKSGSISSFVKLYQIIKQERMGMPQVLNLLKISEEMPYLEARYQHIKDDIDNDGPKVLDLIKQKLSLRNDIQSMLEELPSFRSYVDNELKHEQKKLDEQKASLTNEANKFKECVINEINNSKECLLALRDAADKLKSIQKEVDKLKQEERQLSSRIELKNEELGIQSWSEAQRRRKLREQFIQEPPPQQLGQQERPNLLEQKQGDPIVENAQAILLNQIKLAGRCPRPRQ